MKVFLGDDTADVALGVELEAAAEGMRNARQAPEFHPRAMSAASLADASDESEYLQTLLKLIWKRAGIDPEPRMAPHDGTPVKRMLAALRLRLWRFFRYPFDLFASQQNVINSQVVATLEFMRQADRSEMQRLEARVRELEAKLAEQGDS